jgi:hypothetical protein
MMKRYVLLALAVVCIAVPAAGLYAASRSSATSVPSGDVAVAGKRAVTVAELNKLIDLRLKAAKVAGQPVPKKGSSAYQTQVVTPAVQELVQNAQVQNIADQLGVKVTDSDVQAALNRAITSSFGGSKAKFQAYLKKYGLTTNDARDMLIRPQLVAQSVGSKLQTATPTKAQIAAYYKAHRSQFSTPSQRQVNFILAGSAADAAKAHAAIAGGAAWTPTAKRYAIKPGPPATGGVFTASKGQVEQNFNRVVFGSLPTGKLAAPVKVSAAYEQSSLAGKCHPECYFVIKPTSAIQAGHTQALSQVSSQIAQTLAAQPNQRLVQLVAQQRQNTRYGKAYIAAASTQQSSTAQTR